MRPYNFIVFDIIIALKGFADAFLMKQSRIPAWHVSISHGESVFFCGLYGMGGIITLPDGFSPIPS